MRLALVEAVQHEKEEDSAARIAEAMRLDGDFVKAWEKHFFPLVEAAANIAEAKRKADAAIEHAKGSVGVAGLPRNDAALAKSMFGDV